MPQSNRPITDRPKVEDTSTGNPETREGKPHEEDRSVQGKGSSKAGLNKQSGARRPTPAEEGRDDALEPGTGTGERGS